jgi:hypothetical protein
MNRIIKDAAVRRRYFIGPAEFIRSGSASLRERFFALFGSALLKDNAPVVRPGWSKLGDGAQHGVQLQGQ